MTQSLWFLGTRFNILADATTTGGKYDLLEAYFPPGRQPDTVGGGKEVRLMVARQH